MRYLILLFICLILIGFLGGKLFLQYLITKNYHAREQGKLPDKWYWADILYSKLYNDYSFYKEPQ